MTSHNRPTSFSSPASTDAATGAGSAAGTGTNEISLNSLTARADGVASAPAGQQALQGASYKSFSMSRTLGLTPGGEAAAAHAATGHAALGHSALGQAGIGQSAFVKAALSQTVGSSAIGTAAIGQTSIGNAAMSQAAMFSKVGSLGTAAISQAAVIGKVAAVGNAAIGSAALAAIPGAEPISPLVQLIMRMPGATGMMNSFFEWLQHLFAPSANDLITAFDPATMLNGLGQNLASLVEDGGEFISNLAKDGPLLQNIAHTGPGGLNLIDISKSSSLSSVGDHFIPDPANLGSLPDFSNARFESAGGGLLAGPAISHSSAGSFLSGSQRLFSDQMGGGSAFNSITSNTGVPSTTGIPTGMNVNLTNGGSAVSAGDTALAGPSVGGSNEMAQNSVVSDSAPLKAQATGSGSLADRYGSSNLVADNSGQYSPQSGGYYSPSAGMNSASGDVQPMTAKQMTYADLHKGTAGSKPISDAGTHHYASSKPVIDHIGHQVRDGGNTGNGVDGLAHRVSKAHHAAANHSSREIASNAGKAAPPQTATPAASHRADAGYSNQMQHSAQQGEYAQQGAESARAIDASATPTDQPASYTVQRGDSLWDIAKKNLGDGSRWTEIYKLNSDTLGAQPDLIFAGTELKMPGMDVTKVADASNYVVKPGDNLWNIARDHMGGGEKWGDIYQANASVIGDNPRLIQPGQQLTIPGANPNIAQATTAPSVNISQAPGAAPASSMHISQSPVQLNMAQAPSEISHVGSAHSGHGLGHGAAPHVAHAGHGSTFANSHSAMEGQVSQMSPSIAEYYQPSAPIPEPPPAVASAPVHHSHIASVSEGIPVTESGMIPLSADQMPGAAATAALHTSSAGQSVVSSSLAPDLSWVHRKVQ